MSQKVNSGSGGKSGPKAAKKEKGKGNLVPRRESVLDRYSPLGYTLVRETKSISGITILQEVGKIIDGKSHFYNLTYAEAELSRLPKAAPPAKQEAKPSAPTNPAKRDGKALDWANAVQGTVVDPATQAAKMVTSASKSKTETQQAAPDYAKRSLVRFGVPISFLENFTDDEKAIAKQLLSASQSKFNSLRLTQFFLDFVKDVEARWGKTTTKLQTELAQRASAWTNDQVVRQFGW